jgi:cytochrome c oxidase subunit 2
MMPNDISTHGYMIDKTIFLVTVITVVIAILSFGIIIYSLIAFRESRQPRATLELGFITKLVYLDFVLIFLDILILFFNSQTWLDTIMKDRKDIIAGYEEYVDINVVRRQYFWSFVYPGPDKKFDTNDDFILGDYLVVPKDVPVILTLTSGDVLHSFFIPQMRVKYDTIPGRDTTVWFVAKEVGEYTITCAELCGSEHSRMQSILKVVELDEYQRFIKDYGRWIVKKE